MFERLWIDKATYDKAECLYYERLAKRRKQAKSDSRTEAKLTVKDQSNSKNSEGIQFCGTTGSLAKEVAKARQQIKESLLSVETPGYICKPSSIEVRVEMLEKENRELRKDVDELKKLFSQLKVQST